MDQRKFACGVCEKTFSKPFNLSQHKRTHTGEKPFSCVVCDRKFTQKSNQIAHLKTHRVWPEALRTLQPVADAASKRGFYCCQFCALECESYAACKKHISTYHSNEKVYKCLICSSQLNSIQELSEHKKQYHEADLTPTSGEHECKICHVRFKRADALRWHETVESHHHVCRVCNSVFMSERYLRRHLTIHGDPVSCPTCGKPLKSGKSLRNHMIMHQTDGGLACEFCAKRFPDAYNLRRHTAKHKEKILYCTYRDKYGCEKTFYRKDKLESHIRSHIPFKNRTTEKIPAKSAVFQDTETNVEIYQIFSVHNVCLT